MPYNSSGVFSPLVTFVDGTPATAEDQNSQDSDIATGLSSVMTRGGLSAATANIPMGGFKLTNVGPGTVSTDATNYSQLETVDAKVSSAMVPVTSAASIPAGLTALGGGTAGVNVFEASSTSAGLQALGINSTVVPALQKATPPLVYAALGGAICAPTGRLTLTTATPVLSSTVTAATSVLFTPYNGNQAPLWNGSEWLLQPFSEVSDLLSSTTYSPLAAVAGTVYDEFLFQSAGTWALSRVAWTNSTTRANALTRVNGFLTNSTSITNGPLAGYGLYVGTVMTDISAATVTFAPQPPAASGGPMTGSGGGNPGAWVGLWNEYNRTTVTSTAQDNKTSWSAYTSSAFVTLDSSTNNRITFVSGGSEDSVNVFFALGFGATNGGTAGIGINSTSITTGVTPPGGPFNSVQAVANIIEPLGVTYAQALQYSSASVTFYGFPISQLSVQLRY